LVQGQKPCAKKILLLGFYLFLPEKFFFSSVDDFSNRSRMNRKYPNDCCISIFQNEVTSSVAAVSVCFFVIERCQCILTGDDLRFSEETHPNVQETELYK
jgi:hypothetical protein